MRAKNKNTEASISYLKEFNSHFRSGANGKVVNIDKNIKKTFDFQIQRFEDAVNIFKGSTPPNRFSHYYVAYVSAGYGIKKTGLTEFELKPNTLLFVPSGVINSSHSVSAKTKGYILSFSREYILSKYHDSSFLSALSIFKIGSSPFLYLSKKEGEIIGSAFSIILNEYLSQNDLKDEMLRFYIFELLIKAERVYNKYKTKITGSENSSSRIVNDFKILVEKLFLTEKQVSVYAQKLNIHPNYLNATVKNITGRTCSQWIQERTVLEAKYLLKSSDLSVKEIAEYLSFADAAYFSKYFKNITCISPLGFRVKQNL